MNIALSQPVPRLHTQEVAQTIIDVLWSLMREKAREIAELKQRIKVWKEQLNTNFRNSSRPTSTSQKKGKSARRAASSGMPTRIVLCWRQSMSHTHDCYPDRFYRCGYVVHIHHLAWRHQVIDLPAVLMNVTECRLYARIWQAYGRWSWATYRRV